MHAEEHLVRDLLIRQPSGNQVRNAAFGGGKALPAGRLGGLYKTSNGAIFIGCWESISRAWMSPVTITRTVQTSATPADSRADRVKAAASPPRSSCHPETPSTNIEPVTKAAARYARTQPTASSSPAPPRSR
jgi:hypothetical protein